jgi:hypothetical protein
MIFQRQYYQIFHHSHSLFSKSQRLFHFKDFCKFQETLKCLTLVGKKQNLYISRIIILSIQQFWVWTSFHFPINTHTHTHTHAYIASSSSSSFNVVACSSIHFFFVIFFLFLSCLHFFFALGKSYFTWLDFL